jgi:hypothetical protein
MTKLTRHKRKGEREPKTPMLMPAKFEDAEILSVMSAWPAQIGEALRLAGYGESLTDPEIGHRLWEDKFEHALADSKPGDDILPTIVWLATQGHVAARRVMQRFATQLLQDGKADLSTSVRNYLIDVLAGRVPNHPPDRSEVLELLGRDLCIVQMVDEAAARWALPKLNSGSNRHSAAWFVAVVVELTERQVRRIYQDRKRLADRMARFLLGPDHSNKFQMVRD